VPVKPPREATRPTTERARSVATRPATPPPAGVARPEHRHSGTPAPADAPPPLRTRSAKHPSVEDDPDGTLAPSIE
jgi:hypothetical protein